MKRDNQYDGQCFCGSVRFTLTGAPEAMAFCHCDSCRRWSAGPVSAFSLWHPDQVKITQGQSLLNRFDQNPLTEDKAVVSIRQWCTKCGGHVYTEHPGMGLIDVPAAVIDGLNFEPGFHVHYQETVLPIEDGLPRFKDLPAEAGGSGIQLTQSKG